MSQASDDRADLYADALADIAELIFQSREGPRGLRGDYISQIAAVLDTLGAKLIKVEVAA